MRCVNTPRPSGNLSARDDYETSEGARGGRAVRAENCQLAGSRARASSVCCWLVTVKVRAISRRGGSSKTTCMSTVGTVKRCNEDLYLAASTVAQASVAHSFPCGEVLSVGAVCAQQEADSKPAAVSRTRQCDEIGNQRIASVAIKMVLIAFISRMDGRRIDASGWGSVQTIFPGSGRQRPQKAGFKQGSVT